MFGLKRVPPAAPEAPDPFPFSGALRVDLAARQAERDAKAGACADLERQAQLKKGIERAGLLEDLKDSRAELEPLEAGVRELEAQLPHLQELEDRHARREELRDVHARALKKAIEADGLKKAAESAAEEALSLGRRAALLAHALGGSPAGYTLDSQVYADGAASRGKLVTSEELERHRALDAEIARLRS